jgi:hypothetical protein
MDRTPGKKLEVSEFINHEEGEMFVGESNDN